MTFGDSDTVQRYKTRAWDDLGALDDMVIYFIQNRLKMSF